MYLPSCNFTISHLSLFITYSLLNPAGGRRRMSCKNSVKWPGSPWVLVAQWIECPPGVRKAMGSNPIGTQIFSRSHARVTLLLYSGTCRSNSPQISRMLVIFQNRDLIIAWIIRKFIQPVRILWLSASSISFSARNRVWLNLYERTPSGNEISIITSSFYLWKRQCENLFNVEPFFVFYADSVMLGPYFIPSP